MKNRDKLEYLSGYAMEMSILAAGIEDARIVRTGDGPVPAQPKRKEVAAFADGVSVAFAAVAALIDTGLPVREGTEPEYLIEQLVRTWIRHRDGRDGHR